MSRPDRGPTALQLAYQQHLKNYKPPPAEKPYFQQDYRDVVKFLEEKILNFIRLNPRLRDNIRNRKRFVENKADGIYINFIEFNQGYRAKFIQPDFEVYCMKFIELLKPLLKDFTNEIGFSYCGFTFKFRLEGKTLEKMEGIFLGKKDE